MTRLFGTDGVRGVAGRELTEELARKLGRAAAAVLGRAGAAGPRFLVGRDTRASGEALEAALVEGIRAAGGDAILADVIPTPAVAFLVTDLRADAGAVISASHNPAEYNGIKFLSGQGYKLADELEDRIEASVAQDPDAGPTGVARGEVSRLADAEDRYERHIEASAGRLDGLRVVVDCANGAAWRVGPGALRRLGADVVAIHDAPDGKNINAGCGAMHPEVVGKAVAEQGADAGVAFDGDADRAVFADGDGTVVDGDQVLAASALDLRERGRLARNTVVTTVMANLGFKQAMERAGITVRETKVGDRYVLEEMLASGAVLGGEQSGHVIFLDHATTGDGVLTAAKFLSIAADRGRSVADLASAMERLPQVLVNVEVRDRSGLDEAAEVWEAVRLAERAMNGGGRVLVRPSGTELLVRVMVEAGTEDEARRHADAVARAVAASLGR